MRVTLSHIMAWAGLAALGVMSAARDADACGWTEEVELIATGHPDLPLNGFAAGKLGIVRAELARSYLVVAYRWLAGPALDAREQAGALALWRSRLWIDPSIIDSSQSAQPQSAPLAVSAPWDQARASVLGLPGSGPVPTTITQSYASIDNCLADAFVTAARTLEDRAKRFGKDSPRVRYWVEAQDRVFANCAGGHSIVPSLQAPVDDLDRADRAYQIAASQFYAGDLADAEQSFRRIAADPSSPWRPTARLLVARSLVRASSLRATPDTSVLTAALAELHAIQADPSLAPAHAAARRYEGVVRWRLKVPGTAGDDAIKLARGGLGADLTQVLNDYTWALDADSSPLALTAPDRDRLSAWIGVMQGANAAAFDRAERLYKRTHSAVWLTAALAKGEVSHGARLDPLLAAAEQIDTASPAYATVQYHRLRLMIGRGGAAVRYADIAAVRARLGADAGISTTNAYQELSLRLAPSLDALLTESHVLPAGVTTVDQPVAVPVRPAPGATLEDSRMFQPIGADALSSHLPMSVLERAVQSNTLPHQLRAQLSSAVLVRAVLLGDMAIARRIAATTVADNVALRNPVRAVLAARDVPSRRLALLMMLLEAPNASWTIPAWTTTVPAPGPIDTSYGGYWWCGPAAGSAPAGVRVSFTSASENQAAEREVARLTALGSGATFVANEAAQLADLLPADPRIPRALHLAVRATRYGCKDANTTAASRRAYQKLHRSYPKSEWAEKTPYYY